MLKIYHNPRCKKSRAGLAYLKEKTSDFEIREYLKKPFTPKELIEALQKMNKKPFEIIRKQEEVFRKQYKGKEFPDDQWIKILIENPKLIERPIVVSNNKAVLAQPPENIDELL
ncbi:MAG: arsenate reductase (glutaredoxin) [Bacteroidales bacterium]|nr:arsenate reductase (glutaredoxin) [Bacteroidales bacterium]